MSGGYQTPAGSDLGPLIRELGELGRRLSELEIPTGTSMNSLVAQVQEAIANINTTVNAAITANSYTKTQIDSKIASPGAIAPSTVTASGAITGASLSVSGSANVGGDIGLTGDLYTPHGRSTPVVTSYVAAYINSDGRLGATPSSRQFKKEITAWSPDLQAVFALQLVTFKYKASLFKNEPLDWQDAPVEVGLIAEEMHALGLHWLVVYDDKGAPWGVAYERLALALLPAVQKHESELTDIRAELAELRAAIQSQ